MARTVLKIGKCSIKAQGKILVQLEAKDLPKIGSRAKIKRNSQFKVIGDVSEVIGSTKSPWIVISAFKGCIDIVKHEEEIFIEERSQQESSKKRIKKRKMKRSRSSYLKSQ